ncbi:MAG: LPP20 family lipoprotein [Myxococcales bacterium]|jgi:hypothetical protein|nr:LPP20 family lipoprotein [Myxococcales bacterium]
MRHLKISLLSAAVLLAFTACGSTPEQPTRADLSAPTPMNAHIVNALEGAPEWVVSDCKIYLGKIGRKEMLCAAGAVGGSRNIALMKQNSAQRARVELANMMQSRIKGMMRDYQRSVTGGENFGTAADDEQLVESTSKSIVDTTLSGTESIASWASPTGELWTLVVLDTDSFLKALSNMKQLDARIVEHVKANAEESFAKLDEETSAQ